MLGKAKHLNLYFDLSLYLNRSLGRTWTADPYIISVVL